MKKILLLLLMIFVSTSSSTVFSSSIFSPTVFVETASKEMICTELTKTSDNSDEFINMQERMLYRYRQSIMDNMNIQPHCEDLSNITFTKDNTIIDADEFMKQFRVGQKKIYFLKLIGMELYAINDLNIDTSDNQNKFFSISQDEWNNFTQARDDLKSSTCDAGENNTGTVQTLGNSLKQPFFIYICDPDDKNILFHAIIVDNLQTHISIDTSSDRDKGSMLGHLADEKELISLFKNLQEQTNNFTFNSLTLYGNKSSSDNTTVFIKKDPDQIIEIATSSGMSFHSGSTQAQSSGNNEKQRSWSMLQIGILLVLSILVLTAIIFWNKFSYLTILIFLGILGLMIYYFLSL